MKVGSKYKIARRLGGGVFEKTQTAKYQARAERRAPKFSRPKTGFGAQLLEKQKARMIYGITDRQFRNYVADALQKGTAQNQGLYELLERRLDNIVYRSGFASTRRQARQFVSHGHIKVNGKKLNIASYHVQNNQIISVRKESGDNGAFRDLETKASEQAKASWLDVDVKAKEAKIINAPQYDRVQEHFDLSAVFEFYRR